MRREPAVVVFSHLRWDFVYQRPQHVLSRLAARRRVIVVEEPLHDAAGPRWEKREAAAGVLVYRPHTPAAAPGFCDEQYPVLRDLVARLLEEERPGEYVAWFYTPMALPAAEGLRPRAVVYDCMDELSAFRGCPP